MSQKSIYTEEAAQSFRFISWRLRELSSFSSWHFLWLLSIFIHSQKEKFSPVISHKEHSHQTIGGVAPLCRHYVLQASPFLSLLTSLCLSQVEAIVLKYSPLTCYWESPTGVFAHFSKLSDSHDHRRQHVASVGPERYKTETNNFGLAVLGIPLQRASLQHSSCQFQMRETISLWIGCRSHPCLKVSPKGSFWKEFKMWIVEPFRKVSRSPYSSNCSFLHEKNKGQRDKNDFPKNRLLKNRH